MRLTRKIATLAALAATSLALLAPTTASASLNGPPGSAATWQLSAVALGTVGTCTSAVWSGVVSTNGGPSVGSSGNITYATFSGCKMFGSNATYVAGSVPWLWSVNGSGAGTLTGFRVTATWGSLNCTYAGTLGFTYNSVTGAVSLSGTVTRTSGTALCPASAPFSASGVVI